MQLTDQLIRSVVQDVLKQLHAGKPAAKPNGQARRWGVFDDVDGAAAAANAAQREFEKRGLDDRKKAVQCVRKICIEQAEPLGRDEFEETKIGRLDHKIEKLIV